MDKVRFACPRCQTIMQTGAEKVGYDVACPHCAHRFKLVEPSSPAEKSTGRFDVTLDRKDGSLSSDATIPPANSPAQNRNLSQVPAPARFAASAVGTAQVMPPIPQQTTGFVCPYCQTTKPPRWKSEVSQTGWVVFAALLMTTCFLCFIGLFIRDKYRECSQCKIRLS